MGGGWRLAGRVIGAAATIVLAVFLALAGRSARNDASITKPVPPAPAAVRAAAAPDGRGLPKLGPPDASDGAPLLIPVSGVRAEQLTDTFTQARAGGARHHDAIDILAPRGTPVLTAAAGRVEKLFLSKDGGNTIYVRSPDGRRIYYYAHLDSYAPGLREGMMLRQGAAIGTVGSTGNADPAAPHLHFAIWVMSPGQTWWQEGLALNPYPLLERALPAQVRQQSAARSPRQP